MTRQAYLAALLKTDKGLTFVSNMKHEIAEILGITFRHATTKHAQTDCLLEKTLATKKTPLQVCSVEFRQHGPKFSSLGFVNYNTTDHTSIESEPS